MKDLLKRTAGALSLRQNTVLSAATVIMITYGLSHLLGLVKTWLLVRYFFQNPHLLDAFYAATVIPDAAFQLIVLGSISAAFIPVFTHYLNKDVTAAWDIASTLLNWIMLIFSFISLFLFIFAPFFSRLVAPGFSPLEIMTQSSLLRIMLTAQLFFAVSGFLTGILQSHQHFLIPAIAPLAYNLGIILGTVFFTPVLGIYGPAIGMVIGSMAHMGLQLPQAFKLGFRFRFSLNFRHPGIFEVIRLLPPRMLALGVDQIEQFSAVMISSYLSSGSVSLFNLAKILSYLPVSLFGVSIGQASLPILSRLSSSSNFRAFQKTLTESLLLIAFLALPVSIIFIVLRIPLVRLAFGAPSLPWRATVLTGSTLAILAFSSIFTSLIQLVVRSFYALHNTRTPLFVGLFAALINVVTSYFFAIIMDWGILGIAVGWSSTAFVECSWLIFLIWRRLKVGYKELVLPFSKMAVTGFATGIGLWVPMRLLDQYVFDTTRTLPLLGLTVTTSVIGFSVYLIMSYLFKVEELKPFIALVKRLIKATRYAPIVA